jgi:hypothetical protein
MNMFVIVSAGRRQVSRKARGGAASNSDVRCEKAKVKAKVEAEAAIVFSSFVVSSFVAARERERLRE